MQHEHHRVPVTALAFWDQDVLLSGEGCLLKAYNTTQRSLLTVLQVLPGQAIHGIIVEDGSILVWGGHLICPLAARYDSHSSLVLEAGPVIAAEDWILDASFSPASLESSRRVALVTAHNALYVASISQSLKAELRTQIPGSNCILYAAHVTWLSASVCLVASGTAFGDVIVWSCSVEKSNGEPSSSHQTHYNFSAHEGSVFGVKISSPSVAFALGGRNHILASCSDDRTIRLWDISDLESITHDPVGEQRQTGFGSQSTLDSSAPLCLGKVMGHISRIWHIYFLESQPRDYQSISPGPVHVISFGEDASCNTWELELNKHDSHTYTMKQIEVQKVHTGKNIWSVATDWSNRVATGGADGSVALRSFEDLMGRGQPSEITRSTLKDGNQADGFRTYAFISPSKLIATTNSGRLSLLDLHAEGGIYSKEVSPTMDTLHGYSTMASIPGIAFSAGTQGCVYAYLHEIDEVLRVIETGSKVAGLFSQSPQVPGEASEPTGLLITNVASLSAMFCQITFAPTLSAADNILQVLKYTLTLPPSFVVTSFAHASHAGHLWIVLGSRSGSIAAYSVPSLANCPIAHRLLHSSIHGKEAVTCLRFLKTNDTDPNSFSLLSTGRDGTYAGHRLELTAKDLLMRTVHQLTLPFGPYIEGLDHSPDDHIWIWGFQSKQFVVWDLDTQQEVMKVECGGANRNWIFQIGQDGGTFVWTKASKVYHETHSRLPFQSINSGGHGREIKSLAVSPTNAHLIATGAEDTDIKLSTYKNGAIQCLHTLQKHNTGIQHLQWSADGRFLFSSGGFEEFYIWEISYDVPGLGLGVLCESVHPNSGSSDLRIMSFGALSHGDGDKRSFDITMVCSDSSVRAWRYVSKTWSLLATGSYLTSCLTQCLTPMDGESSLITASTDGYLVMWKIAVEQECILWTSRHQVHQSAILSMMSLDLVGSSRLIITGGDDNALGITRLWNGGEETRTLLVPRAHAAAVTALAIVGKESDRLWVVSASIDQRIKLWQIDLDMEKPGVDGIDIKLLQSSSTAVADVSSIDLLRFSTGESGVLVCGVGMCFWRLGKQ